MDKTTNINGPVTFNDLKFIFSFKYKGETLLNIESLFKYDNRIPFFYPSSFVGGVEGGISLFKFLNEGLEGKYRFESFFNSLEINEDILENFNPFEKAFLYMCCSLVDLDSEHSLTHYSNDEDKTLNFIKEHVNHQPLIDFYINNFYKEGSAEEAEVIKINILSDDIKNSQTPTAINVSMDISTNEVDISELFEIATEDIRQDCNIAGYLYYYHFYEPLSYYVNEYNYSESLSDILTEEEYENCAELMYDNPSVESIESEKSLINWILQHKWGISVLEYKGQDIVLKFSEKAIPDFEGNAEIENINLFSNKNCPKIIIKLFK